MECINLFWLESVVDHSVLGHLVSYKFRPIFKEQAGRQAVYFVVTLFGSIDGFLSVWFLIQSQAASFFLIVREGHKSWNIIITPDIGS